MTPHAPSRLAARASAAAVSIVLTLGGCVEDAPSADGLDAGWKEDIGWPEADPNAAASVQVTDPGRMAGTFTIELYGGECRTTWTMDGTRTDCRDCDYAFQVELDPVDDGCGYGRWDAQMQVANGFIYLNYNRMASVEVIGNVLTWDSRDGDDEPYGYDGYYGEYYYGYYSTVYYGTGTLYAR